MHMYVVGTCIEKRKGIKAVHKQRQRRENTARTGKQYKYSRDVSSSCVCMHVRMYVCEAAATRR